MGKHLAGWLAMAGPVYIPSLGCCLGQGGGSVLGGAGGVLGWAGHVRLRLESPVRHSTGGSVSKGGCCSIPW
jgi:hypothetical protein